MSYGITIRSRDKVLLVVNFSYILHILCLLAVVYAVFNPRGALSPQKRFMVLAMGCISLYYNRGMYGSLLGNTPSSANIATPSMDPPTSDTISDLHELYETGKYSAPVEDREYRKREEVNLKEDGDVKFTNDINDKTLSQENINSGNNENIDDMRGVQPDEL